MNRVYHEAGNVIGRHEQAGAGQRAVAEILLTALTSPRTRVPITSRDNRSESDAGGMRYPLKPRTNKSAATFRAGI